MLIATGLVHAGIWAVVGGSAAGPLSWRKPTTFGISFGLTTATLGWVATWLPVRRRTGWVGAWLLCAATTVEVAWVSLRHARGVPSHFNTATTLDFALFVIGGVAIAVTVVVIAAMTIGAFTRATAAPPMALAIRSGLVALLAAQAVGVWMIVRGMSLVNAGGDPLTQSMSTYGAAGAMKDAHAVPMHAIQVLVAVAWLLSFSGLPQRRQVWLVALAVVGYAGLVGTVLLRTANGLGPFELRSVSTAAYLIAAGLLAAAAIAAIAGNQATGGIWRVDGPAGRAVVKIASAGRGGQAAWATSERGDHWNYWRREPLAYQSGFAHSVYADAGLGAPRLLAAAPRPGMRRSRWRQGRPGRAGLRCVAPGPPGLPHRRPPHRSRR